MDINSFVKNKNCNINFLGQYRALNVWFIIYSRSKHNALSSKIQFIIFNGERYKKIYSAWKIRILSQHFSDKLTKIASKYCQADDYIQFLGVWNGYAYWEFYNQQLERTNYVSYNGRSFSIIIDEDLIKEINAYFLIERSYK